MVFLPKDTLLCRVEQSKDVELSKEIFFLLTLFKKW
jgi:hypothetical protein